MASTSIPFGSALAGKVYGAAVFAEYCTTPSFSNRLTGAAPNLASAAALLEKMQTSHHYPFLRVTDLSKGAADTVSVDCFNILEGRPVVGDTRLAGKMMGLTSSSMDMTVNQIRAGVDSGGRMSQQRTKHNLRTVAKAGLGGWWTRFMDQMKLVHLAGARGSQNGMEWVLPLASDPEFASYMVNTVKAPTYNRHFYAGDATALSNLDTTDYLKLSDLDRLRTLIDEMDNPLQPVKLDGDFAADEDPLYILLVSPRVYSNLLRQSGTTAIRTFQSNAAARGAKNPVFTGTVGLWNGILVKKMPRTFIEFASSEVVTTATSAAAYTETTTTVAALGANYPVHRCLLLGAQAYAEAFGKDADSGTHINWNEELTDHKNVVETSLRTIMGGSKIRFTNKAGVDYDYGCAVIDTVAPSPSVALA
jgi:N4-gp56 family major capsid protein